MNKHISKDITQNSKNNFNGKKQAIGLLLGLRVVVLDINESRKIYSEGFFGKPLALPKPRPETISEPLELSLIEAAYLTEKERIVVKDLYGNKLSYENILKLGSKHIPRILSLYMVYKDLRDKGLIVRSGMKFGADFAVYEKGPGKEHAPYLVHVLDEDDQIDPIELVRAGRLSHSVRKKFIIAIVSKRTGKVTYIAFNWHKF